MRILRGGWIEEGGFFDEIETGLDPLGGRVWDSYSSGRDVYGEGEGRSRKVPRAKVSTIMMIARFRFFLFLFLTLLIIFCLEIFSNIFVFRIFLAS